MAFLAETGDGTASANSYIDVAFADTYHADRGHTAWAGVLTTVTTQQKQEALIRATDHIDRTFGTMYKGYKSTDAQGLEWPRSNARSPNGYSLLEVPAALQKATAEYAIRALLYGVLTPDPPPETPRQALTEAETLPEYGEGQGKVVLTRDKVGPIETERRFSKTASTTLPSHPAADMMLRPLLRAANSRIVRG